MDNDVVEKLNDITTEDYIWVVYIFIIILSYVSNYYERKYLLKKNEQDKELYHKMMILIFLILVIIYFYFFYSSYKSVRDLKPNDSEDKKKLVKLAYYASILICISGLIYLYVAIQDDNLDVELAFN